jgi:hypothetical protein
MEKLVTKRAKWAKLVQQMQTTVVSFPDACRPFARLSNPFAR